MSTSRRPARLSSAFRMSVGSLWNRPTRRHRRIQQPACLIEHLEDRTLLSVQPVSDRVTANTYLPQQQNAQAVAIDGQNRFTVVWQDSELDGSGTGIYLRQFNADGTPRANPVRANTTTELNQQSPAIASNSTGDFVVVWEDVTAGGTNLGQNIRGQRFSAAGAKVGGEFSASSDALLNQGGYAAAPKAFMHDDGRFTVSYLSTDLQDGTTWIVHVRQFNAAGVSTGEFTIPLPTSGEGWQIAHHSYINVQFTKSGTIDVASVETAYPFVPDVGQSYAGKAWIDRFRLDGTRVGTRISVYNETTFSELEGNWLSQRILQSVPLADGGFLVHWRGVSGSLIVRQFNANGTAVSNATTLIAASDVNVADSAIYTIAQLSTGHLLVGWSNGLAFSDDTSFLAEFTLAGQRLGEPVLVDSTLYYQGAFAFAVNNQGGVVASWSDAFGPSGGDKEANTYVRVYQSDTKAPGVPPAVTGPVAVTRDITPTIRWTAVAGATAYDLWVDNLTTGKAQVIRQTSLSVPEYTPFVALTGGNYRVWVRSINSQGTASAWSQPANFTINTVYPAGLEPNDEFETATDIGDGSRTFANLKIDNDDDWDWYLWTADATGTWTVELKNSSKPADLQLLLLDSDTNTVAFGEGSPTIRAETEVIAERKYYVLVRHSFEAAVSSRPTYDLVITGPNRVTIPTAPTLTAPSGSTNNTTPAFTWTAVSGATTYDLWVDNRTTGQKQVIRQQSLTASPYSPVTALPAGNYRAWLSASNSAGTSAWSAAVDFTVTASGQVPGRPTFSSPTGTTTNAQPQIQWSAASGATRYDLWVDNRSTGQAQVIRQQNLTATSYTPASALPAGNYRAWIRAANAAGEGMWSTALDFTISTTSAVPGRPTITAPTGTTSNTKPTIQWSTVQGATRYDLWVDNRTTGQTQVIRNENITSTSFTPTTALAGGMYRVWVRAANTAGVGAWSVLVDFTITVGAQIPSRPTLTAPTGTVTTPMPTFTWTAISNATHYDLWVDNRTTGQSEVIRNQSIASTSFTSTTSLAVGTYRVWVRAVNDAGASAWSVQKDFTINANL